MKVRKGGSEEIPLVQGKEQRLRFAGAAMRRYPMPKVRETQVRQIGRASCRERVEIVSDFIFLGSKITTDGDCSHVIERCLLLGQHHTASADTVFADARALT